MNKEAREGKNVLKNGKIGHISLMPTYIHTSGSRLQRLECIARSIKATKLYDKE